MTSLEENKRAYLDKGFQSLLDVLLGLFRAGRENSVQVGALPVHVELDRLPEPLGGRQGLADGRGGRHPLEQGRTGPDKTREREREREGGRERDSVDPPCLHELTRRREKSASE